MGEPKLKLYYTREDHLRLLEESEKKFELVDGALVAMAGTRLHHSRIISNIMARAAGKIIDRGCDMNSEALNIHPPLSRDAFIPDIVVHCTDENAPNEMVVEHPIAIFEVLSPGREDYDRVFKFAEYSRIPSLRHYVLVSQAAMDVENRFRETETADWQTERLTRPDDRLIFTEVPFDLTLAQMYARIPLA